VRPRYSGGVADGVAERAEYDDEGDEGEETTDEERRLGGVEVRAEVRVPWKGVCGNPDAERETERETERGSERDSQRGRERWSEKE
jgi:hypothetical protein